MAFRSGQCGEAEGSIERMCVTGDEAQPAKRLEARVFQEYLNEPSSEALPAVLFQHVYIGEVRVRGPIGNSASKSDLDGPVKEAGGD